MNASSRWQEVIADNLSIASLPGARKLETVFSTVEAGLGGPNRPNPVMPSAGTGVNFQPGAMYPTNDTLDLAIEGKGFFEIQLPNGQLAYTRNGDFRLDAQGRLVTGQGYAVMSDAGPLQLDPSNHDPISVTATGEISQGGDAKGKLRVVEFKNPQLLSRMGAAYFLADNPEAQMSDVSESKVAQGFLEASNLSAVTEMASLVTAMRLFESNQRVLQMYDERSSRVISELGNPG